MNHLVLPIGVLALATSACVTPTRGDTAARVSRALPTVGDQVAFDHGNCPVERIRMIRSGPDTPTSGTSTVDWDVCGSVRRYKSFDGGPSAFVTWLDVTSLYPASSLPAPLPPK